MFKQQACFTWWLHRINESTALIIVAFFWEAHVSLSVCTSAFMYACEFGTHSMLRVSTDRQFNHIFFSVSFFAFYLSCSLIWRKKSMNKYPCKTSIFYISWNTQHFLNRDVLFVIRIWSSAWNKKWKNIRLRKPNLTDWTGVVAWLHARAYILLTHAHHPS